jgi:hypothetical protein
MCTYAHFLCTAQLVFLVHISPAPRRDHIYVFFFPPRAAEFIGRSSAKLFISRAKCVLLKTDPGLVCAFDEFCVRCMNYFMGSCHASRPDKAIKCFNVCVWPNGETPFWCTRLMSLAGRGKPQIYSNSNRASQTAVFQFLCEPVKSCVRHSRRRMYMQQNKSMTTKLIPDFF